jgi:hypothetical protein
MRNHELDQPLMQRRIAVSGGTKHFQQASPWGSIGMSIALLSAVNNIFPADALPRHWAREIGKAPKVHCGRPPFRTTSMVVHVK